jgi:hypothetical protein
MLKDAIPLPLNSTVTAAPVSNSNPDGAFRMIVPDPMFPALVSVMVGPVNGDQEPAALHATAVLEATEPPPVAGITVAATAPPQNQTNTNNAARHRRKNPETREPKHLSTVIQETKPRNIAINTIALCAYKTMARGMFFIQFNSMS